jgi:cation/acetate symporter
LLVAGASAFSHDLYVKVINPKASPKLQLTMARAGTVLMAVIVILIAILELGLIGELVAVAFSLAGCTIFPLFLLGIWWSGSNRSGAVAGLITGGAISLISIAYFIAGFFDLTWPAHEFISYWLGAWYFAWIGAPLAIIVNIIVSKMTKPTPVEIKKFLVETGS